MYIATPPAQRSRIACTTLGEPTLFRQTPLRNLARPLVWSRRDMQTASVHAQSATSKGSTMDRASMWQGKFSQAKPIDARDSSYESQLESMPPASSPRRL